MCDMPDSSSLKHVLNGVAKGEVGCELIHWRNRLMTMVGADGALRAIRGNASVTKSVPAWDRDRVVEKTQADGTNELWKLIFQSLSSVVLQENKAV